MGKIRTSVPDIRPMSDAEAAWLAGIYEGEGTIGFYKNGKKFGPYLGVTIAQNGIDLPETIMRMTGLGRVNRKTDVCYSWRTCNTNVIAFMTAISPHMRVKYKIEQMVSALSKYLEHVSKPRKTVQKVCSTGYVKYVKAEQFIAGGN